MNSTNFDERSLIIHRQLRGKIAIHLNFPNQVNNVLASAVEEPSDDYILPDPLDPSVAPRVARAVKASWNAEDKSTKSN